MRDIKMNKEIESVTVEMVLDLYLGMKKLYPRTTLNDFLDVIIDEGYYETKMKLLDNLNYHNPIPSGLAGVLNGKKINGTFHNPRVFSVLRVNSPSLGNAQRLPCVV